MNRAINSFLLFLGFLPFFVSADQDWISPEQNLVDSYIHQLSAQVFYDLDAAALDYCQTSVSALNSGECLSAQAIPSTTAGYFDVLKTYRFRACGACAYTESTITNYIAISTAQTTQSTCTDPEYQDGRDTDGLNGIDQCWHSDCPNNNLFWSNGNGVATPSGSICVVNPISGQSCKYNAIENSDGSSSNFTFEQSGEGCGCNDEFVPCNPLEDGEITNYPQGQDGCVAMGDSIFCEADPNVECSEGVCNDGCGYVDQVFMCSESQLDPIETEPCQSGDSRPSCAGVADGDCPAGVINCGGNVDPDSPPPACAANDSRQECAGLNEGDIPQGGEGGATSDDISALGELLRQGNNNTKSIKDNTKKIADRLDETIDHPDNLNPSTDWSDTKTLIDQFTSADDVNASESQFKTDFSSQEGFYNQQILGVIPTGGTCQNLTFDFPYATGVIDACQYLVHAKIVIEWAMVLGFFFYIRSTFNRLKPS